MINPDSKYIYFSQLHMAKTMAVDKKLVTCNFKNVKHVLPDLKEARWYELYNIKNYGNFTSRFARKCIQGFEDVSYLQVK